MKKILFSFTILALFFGCGPSTNEENELSQLVGEWKTTADDAASLNEAIGDRLLVLEGIKKEAAQPDSTITITMDEMQTNCKTELENLQLKMDTFLQEWEESSNLLNDMTTRMEMARWTAEDSEQLKALELELRQKEADLALWKEDLEKIKSKCDLTMDTFQEVESS